MLPYPIYIRPPGVLVGISLITRRPVAAAGSSSARVMPCPPCRRSNSACSVDDSSGLVFRRPQAASHRRAVVYFCSAVLRYDSRCGICESGYAIERRGEQPCRSEFHPSATKSEHGNACSWEGRFTDCRYRRARRFECCPRPIAVRVIQNERRNGEGLEPRCQILVEYAK